MENEELIQFLQEHLKVNVMLDRSTDFYSSGFRLKVSISIDDELITSSSDTFTLETSSDY